MRRWMIVPILILALTAVTAGPVAGATPDPASGSGSPGAFLEALAMAPDTPEARRSMLSYLDLGAVAAARPGAAQPGSVAELQTLFEVDDPAAERWLAALRGVVSGDADLITKVYMAAGWLDILGFDLLDVERHLSFGEPPSDGSILLGDVDPDTIASAFAAQGYSSSPKGDWTLLCGAAGCDKGMAPDIANADRSLPFGREIGRSEPLAVSQHGILSSADLVTLEAMLATAAGEAPSLLEDPAYRAVASAAAPDALLVQATLLPGIMAAIGLDLGPLDASPAELAQRADELEPVFEPMPMAEVIAILDGATPTEQVVTIALAYASDGDAAAAAEVLPRRLEALPTLRDGTPLADLLSSRGVTSISGSVVPAGEGTLAVARVELRAPLAGDEPDEGTGALEASSRLYDLFVRFVYARDLLWLAPNLPLP